MADSTLIPSNLVYKGKPNDNIVRTEFPSGVCPSTHFYKCQEAAWMDEAVMIAWVNEVLVCRTSGLALDHVIPIPILDIYQCHMMASVVQMIQELSAKVKHIPGGCGCTSLCQPMDGGVNKPFKDRLLWQWMNWIIVKGVVHSTTSSLSKVYVAKWVSAAMAEMKGKGEIIRNAWKRHGYEWFPKDAGEQDAGGDDEGGAGGISFKYQFNKIFNYNNI